MPLRIWLRRGGYPASSRSLANKPAPETFIFFWGGGHNGETCSLRRNSQVYLLIVNDLGESVERLKLADFCLFRGAEIGRSPPLVTRASVGQVECKRLISTNAIDWSVTMQMGGQVHAITQAHIKNRQTTTRLWKTTGLQGLLALPIGARVASKIWLTVSRTSAKPEPYQRCPRQHPGSQNL
ncbi:hypothetical protein D3C87_1582120 [compost metagenome]